MEEENSTKVISAASLSHICSSESRSREGERMSVSVGMRESHCEGGWGNTRSTISPMDPNIKGRFHSFEDVSIYMEAKGQWYF